MLPIYKCCTKITRLLGINHPFHLRPDYSREKSQAITNKKTSQRERLEAVTEYKVLSNFNSAALVQCNMSTGRWEKTIEQPLLRFPSLGNTKFDFILASVLALPSLETTSTPILTSWTNPRE